MKNTRVLLAIIYIPLAFILAFAPIKTNKPTVKPEEVLSELSVLSQYVSYDTVHAWLNEQNPLVQLVDVRTPEEYEVYSLPGAFNIPLSQVLDKEFEGFLNQDIYKIIFYSNGTSQALEAWILTRMKDYHNLYVLMGGLNNWFDPGEEPPATSPYDEIARYNYKKAAQGSMDASLDSLSAAPTIIPMAPVKKGTKKKVSGGC